MLLLTEGTRVIFTAEGRNIIIERVHSSAEWLRETHIYISRVKYSMYDVRADSNGYELCMMRHWIEPYVAPTSKKELEEIIKRLDM